MSIHTTTARNLTVGTNLLKRINDGHYYGIVADVERLTNRKYDWQDDYRITFEDGDTIVRRGTDPLHYKTEA